MLKPELDLPMMNVGFFRTLRFRAISAPTRVAQGKGLWSVRRLVTYQYGLLVCGSPALVGNASRLEFPLHKARYGVQRLRGVREGA
jgi:hypothetical protein